MNKPSLCSNWAAQIWWAAAATLRLSYYCLVRGHLLATSAWTFSRSYYRQLLCVWATAWYVAICFLPQRGDVLSQLLDHLLCVWATTTAWYMAICLLPARGRSLAAIIRHLLACRVPELSIIPTWRARTENKKSQSSFRRVQQSCHARSSRLLGQRLFTRCMCKYSREHSCVYVVGIIQYWERILISVLLSSDPKIPS